MLKVPKCEIFDPSFFTPINSYGYVTGGLENFFIFSKTTADIRHFVFFAHAECALKKAYEG
jgi:hypothetical protein